MVASYAERLDRESRCGSYGQIRAPRSGPPMSSDMTTKETIERLKELLKLDPDKTWSCPEICWELPALLERMEKLERVAAATVWGFESASDGNGCQPEKLEA